MALTAAVKFTWQVLNVIIGLSGDSNSLLFKKMHFFLIGVKPTTFKLIAMLENIPAHILLFNLADSSARH